MTQSKRKTSQATDNKPSTEPEDLYASLVERSQDGIITVKDGVIKFANSRFARITEYDIDELVGHNAEMALSPDSMECLEQRKQDLMLGKELKNIFEMKLLSQSGRVISVEANVALIDYQDEVMDMLILREISERKPAEALSFTNESDKWLHSIIEGAPNLILVVDREGKIQFANHGSASRQKEELKETSLFDYIALDYHSVVSETLQDVFESGKQGYFVIQRVSSDGTKRWYETQIGPIKQHEEIVAATLVNSDITERKRREEKIEEKYQEVEVRSYEMEAANSEMQHTQAQLLELNQKLLDSQSKLSETMSYLREAQADPSTPVVQLWDKILMLPMLGITNSQQAREMMDNLINKINETKAETVMLDISGIAPVDDFLIRILDGTISMAEMMGAKAEVVGVQPEVAVMLKEHGIKVGQSA